MYLKIVSLKRDGTDGSIFLMTTTKCTIGKSNNCLLRVKENDVQDVHCEVYTEDGQIYLKAFALTFHNGKEVLPDQPVVINDKDTFLIANKMFRIEIEKRKSMNKNAFRGADISQTLIARKRSAGGTFRSTPGNESEGISNEIAPSNILSTNYSTPRNKTPRKSPKAAMTTKTGSKIPRYHGNSAKKNRPTTVAKCTTNVSKLPISRNAKRELIGNVTPGAPGNSVGRVVSSATKSKIQTPGSSPRYMSSTVSSTAKMTPQSAEKHLLIRPPSPALKSARKQASPFTTVPSPKPPIAPGSATRLANKPMIRFKPATPDPAEKHLRTPNAHHESSSASEAIGSATMAAVLSNSGRRSKSRKSGVVEFSTPLESISKPSPSRQNEISVTPELAGSSRKRMKLENSLSKLDTNALEGIENETEISLISYDSASGSVGTPELFDKTPAKMLETPASLASFASAATSPFESSDDRTPGPSPFVDSPALRKRTQRRSNAGRTPFRKSKSSTPYAPMAEESVFTSIDVANDESIQSFERLEADLMMKENLNGVEDKGNKTVAENLGEPVLSLQNLNEVSLNLISFESPQHRSSRRSSRNSRPNSRNAPLSSRSSRPSSRRSMKSIAAEQEKSLNSQASAEGDIECNQNESEDLKTPGSVAATPKHEEVPPVVSNDQDEAQDTVPLPVKFSFKRSTSLRRSSASGGKKSLGNSPYPSPRNRLSLRRQVLEKALIPGNGESNLSVSGDIAESTSPRQHTEIIVSPAPKSRRSSTNVENAASLGIGSTALPGIIVSPSPKSRRSTTNVENAGTEPTASSSIIVSPAPKSRRSTTNVENAASPGIIVSPSPGTEPTASPGIIVSPAPKSRRSTMNVENAASPGTGPTASPGIIVSPALKSRRSTTNVENAGTEPTASPGIIVSPAPKSRRSTTNVENAASPGTGSTASPGIIVSPSPGIGPTASPGIIVSPAPKSRRSTMTVENAASPGTGPTASPGIIVSPAPKSRRSTMNFEIAASSGTGVNKSSAGSTILQTMEYTPSSADNSITSSLNFSDASPMEVSRDFEFRRRRSKNKKMAPTPRLLGVKELLRTPKPAIAATPRIEEIRLLFGGERAALRNANAQSATKSVRNMFQQNTEQRVTRSTPDLRGLKEIVKTPKQSATPNFNDLRHLYAGERAALNAPSSASRYVGVKEMYTRPDSRKGRASDALEDLQYIFVNGIEESRSPIGNVTPPQKQVSHQTLTRLIENDGPATHTRSTAKKAALEGRVSAQPTPMQKRQRQQLKVTFEDGRGTRDTPAVAAADSSMSPGVAGKISVKVPKSRSAAAKPPIPGRKTVASKKAKVQPKKIIDQKADIDSNKEKSSENDNLEIKIAEPSSAKKGRRKAAPDADEAIKIAEPSSAKKGRRKAAPDADEAIKISEPSPAKKGRRKVAPTAAETEITQQKVETKTRSRRNAKAKQETQPVNPTDTEKTVVEAPPPPTPRRNAKTKKEPQPEKPTDTEKAVVEAPLPPKRTRRQAAKIEESHETEQLKPTESNKTSSAETKSRRAGRKAKENSNLPAVPTETSKKTRRAKKEVPEPALPPVETDVPQSQGQKNQRKITTKKSATKKLDNGSNENIGMTSETLENVRTTRNRATKAKLAA